MFRLGTKYKLKQPSTIVTLQLNHALSTPPNNFCLQPKRMYHPLHIMTTLSIKFFATMIVSTWVKLLKGCNRGLSNLCLKPFFRDILLKIETHWPALASQSEALELKLLSPLQDNISYKTLHAHINVMITNFPFLLMAVLLFIFPPFKLFTLKHPNQIYVNRRNSCMA